MLDLTILTKYTTKGASSRYRYFLYLRSLLKEDTNFEIDSFLDTSYLYNVYAKKSVSKLKVLIAYFKRIFTLCNSAKNLIIEYEAFPYLPYIFEKWFLKNKKYILNFDDNVWENYTDKSLLVDKYDSLVASANGVIVANDFLREKVSKLNANVIKIPTVVDLDTYQKASKEKFEKFSLVWIGTPTTYQFIESHKEIFQELAKQIDYQLIIIAAQALESQAIDGVNMQFYDWSSVSEVELLKQSHVGIMPLDDTAWTGGKSSFKIIQYMAAGLPIVASNIGENNKVIADGENGFTVGTRESWVKAIGNLYEDKQCYEQFAQNALACAYDYSLQKYETIFTDFIKDTFKG